MYVFMQNEHHDSTAMTRFRVFSSIALIVASFSLALAATPQWPPPEPVQQRLAQAIELIDDLQRMTPAYSDDLNDMAFAMEFDIEQAIRQVRDAIQFVPYAGVLRGIEGTYSTQAGNSWDQSLLLAALIKTIGGDAQIVSGTVQYEDAERLLRQAFSDGEDASKSGGFNPEAMLERVAEYDRSLADQVSNTGRSAAVSEELEALNRETEQMAGRLVALMEKQDIRLNNEMSSSALITSLAQDYAWVRWRLGPDSEWQHVHPAFGNEPPPTAEPANYFDDQIPEEHQHRIAFELFIERTTNRTAEQVRVMSRFERPTAQLHKQPLALGMGPLPNGNVESGAVLVPVMNEQLAPGAQAVTEQGLTVDAGDAASAAGQLFATVSNSMGQAIGALSDAAGPEESSAPRLTGVILKVEFISPGQPAQVVERRIVDLRETVRADDLPFPRSATVGLSLEIDIGAKNEAHLTRELLDQQRRLLEAIPALMTSARGDLSYREAGDSREIRQLGPARWVDFELFSGVALPKPGTEQVAFRTGPMVAMRRTFADRANRNDGGLLSVSDILANPIQVLRQNDSGSPVLDSIAAVQQGVRETLLESELALHNGGWSQRIPSGLITGPEALQRHAAEADWPVQALEVATNDLDEGYVLAMVDSAPPHWWRVHPNTGQTLGMSQYGGSETVFYVTLVGGALISAYFFRDSVQSCDKTYANNQEMADCCIVGNLGATYATSVVTSGSSALQAAPWAAANGRVIAGLEITGGLIEETATNTIVGEVTKKPIDSICTTYLNRQ